MKDAKVGAAAGAISKWWDFQYLSRQQLPKYMIGKRYSYLLAEIKKNMQKARKEMELGVKLVTNEYGGAAAEPALNYSEGVTRCWQLPHFFL